MMKKHLFLYSKKIEYFLKTNLIGISSRNSENTLSHLVKAMYIINSMFCLNAKILMIFPKNTLSSFSNKVIEEQLKEQKRRSPLQNKKVHSPLKKEAPLHRKRKVDFSSKNLHQKEIIPSFFIEANPGTITNLKKKPDLVVIFDTQNLDLLVKEAYLLQIPTIAFIDPYTFPLSLSKDFLSLSQINKKTSLTHNNFISNFSFDKEKLKDQPITSIEKDLTLSKEFTSSMFTKEFTEVNSFYLSTKNLQKSRATKPFGLIQYASQSIRDESALFHDKMEVNFNSKNRNIDKETSTLINGGTSTLRTDGTSTLRTDGTSTLINSGGFFEENSSSIQKMMTLSLLQQEELTNQRESLLLNQNKKAYLKEMIQFLASKKEKDYSKIGAHKKTLSFKEKGSLSLKKRKKQVLFSFGKTGKPQKYEKIEIFKKITYPVSLSLEKEGSRYTLLNLITKFHDLQISLKN